MSFQAPKGVSEYVPPRSALFEEARAAFADSARRACYASVETAVFEDTGLFVRGVGESSDVVRKEMYSFESRGGDMAHYVGDPMSDDIVPYETDHAPFLP